MAPNLTTTTAIFLTETQTQNPKVFKNEGQTLAHRGKVMKRSELNQKEVDLNQKEVKQEYKWDIQWRNVIAFIYLHTFACYGIYLAFTEAKGKTIYWGKYRNVHTSHQYCRYVNTKKTEYLTIILDEEEKFEIERGNLKKVNRFKYARR